MTPPAFDEAKMFRIGRIHEGGPECVRSGWAYERVMKNVLSPIKGLIMNELAQLIDGVEMYVKIRQVGIAKAMAVSFIDKYSTTIYKESGYAILAVVASYFEMIEQFSVGASSDNQSKCFFMNGFKKVYPTTTLNSSQIESIYKLVRCGMYHGGMAKFGVELSRDFTIGFTCYNNKIQINPSKVVDEIEQHFLDYVSQLRDVVNVSQRESFLKYCEYIDLTISLCGQVDHPDKHGSIINTHATAGPTHYGNSDLLK